MAYLGTGIEYALHCLIWLVDPPTSPVSSRELAALQGVSPAFLAKIFPKLEKAGIVQADEGILGGYRLKQNAADITVLDVVEAIDGRKSFFVCQEVRGKCAVFGGHPPEWSVHGTCAVHAVMIRAEQRMRDELSRTSLAELARTVMRKAPEEFPLEIEHWLLDRAGERRGGRQTDVGEKIAGRSRSV